MREAALLIVVAIVLYVAADRALDVIERRAGRRLEHRSLIFFAILLSLALFSFWIIRVLFEGQA